MDKKYIDKDNEIKSESLLLHWFHYYGKSPYTLDELEKFKKVIDKYSEKIFEFIFACNIAEIDPNVCMISAIRKDIVDLLFDSLPNTNNFSDEDKKMHDKIIKSIKDEIISSYQNPEPNNTDVVMILTKNKSQKKNDN